MGGAWCEHNDYPETCPPCRRAAGVDPSLAHGLVIEDEVQDETDAWWLIPGLIAVGGLLSFGVAPPTIAAASVLAFVVSELADWGIYTPLRRHGWVFAALVSSIIGGAIDSALFLRVAFDSVDGWLPLAIAKTIVVTGTVLAVDRWRK